MRKTSMLLALMALAALGSGGCTTADNTNTATNTTANSNAGRTTSNGTLGNSTNTSSSNTGSAALSEADKKFMTEAAQGGMEEVELGRLAEQKGQNAAVKDFGKRMVTDHTKANNELKAVAAQKGVMIPADVNSEQKSDMDKLSKLSGAAFDKAYMQDMVDDHEKDVKDFEKQSTDAKDSDLKAFAAKTLPTLKEHLQMAKDTAAKVK